MNTNNMYTLEQIKQDIKDGKSKKIYYSTHTLWWTHLDSDLQEATIEGLKEKRTSLTITIHSSDETIEKINTTDSRVKRKPIRIVEGQAYVSLIPATA